MSVFDRLRTNVFPLFSEATRVSRYLVLPDFVGDLTIGGNAAPSDAHAQFELPGIVAQFPAVLFLTVQPHAVDTRIQVRDSQHGAGVLLRHTFTDGEPKSWHRVVPALGLRATGNELVFSVSGEGDAKSATFADVVILYTVDRTTVRVPMRVVEDT